MYGGNGSQGIGFLLKDSLPITALPSDHAVVPSPTAGMINE